MLSMQQILMLLLAAVPYLGVIIFLIFTRRLKEFSLTTVFLGLFGFAIALGAGIVGGFLVISAYPQTNSTLTESFLIGVFAVVMGVALIAGELFRFLILRSPEKEERSRLAGLAYGVGFSLGEYIFFVVMSVMSQESILSLDMALMLLADIVIELGISIVAYELIRQNNYASFAVGGLYYLSLFLLMALNSSIVLNIAAKVIVLIVVIALLIAYLPDNKKHQRGEVLR